MNIDKYIGSKKIYLNIQILRMILSFNILLFHFTSINNCNSKLSDIIIKPTSFYLGTFFLLSFYFSYNSFLSRNIERIKQRFVRIMVSYFIWPIIFFIINNLLFYIFKTKEKIKLKLLFYQLIIGNGFYCVFWFQFNLIIVSIIFLIIIFSFRNNYKLILGLVGIVLYYFRHSRFYHEFYYKYTDIITFPIMPIPTTYIYCLTGFYLSSIEFIDKIKRHKKKALFFVFIILYSIKDYNLIFKKYPYLRSFILDLGALCLFTLFSILPFDDLKNNNYIYIIKHVTNYTGGIFYLHPKILVLTSNTIFKNMLDQIILLSIINYLLCFLICLICSKILISSNLKYLFL